MHRMRYIAQKKQGPAGTSVRLSNAANAETSRAISISPWARLDTAARGMLCNGDQDSWGISKEGQNYTVGGMFCSTYLIPTGESCAVSDLASKWSKSLL